MSKLLRVLVLLPVFGLASCGGGGEGGEADTLPLSAPDPQSDYVIGFGETARFQGLTLEFTAVADDSRCPNNPLALCVWEGNGRILVTATRGTATSVLELNTNARFAVSAAFEGYVITLEKLDPYPGVTPIPVHTYEATLRIARGNP